MMEVVRAATNAEVKLATMGKLLTELRGLPEETVHELLPAVGLALRRVS